MAEKLHQLTVAGSEVQLNGADVITPGRSVWWLKVSSSELNAESLT